jgi:signal peptidase I
MSQNSMSKADTKAGKAAKSEKNEWVETLVVIIEALVIAVVFRTFLWQPFSIPTGSLQPTMLIGDYFLANKFTWGLSKYSFIVPLPIQGRLLAFSEPVRGDIAVFHNITNEDYVKRIIGMPGDRIQMKEGRLYINGTMIEREEIGPGRDVGVSGQSQDVTLYRETLPNGLVHTIQEVSDREQLDDTEEFTVPPGHYFMMGDNRDNSLDSRAEIITDSRGNVRAGVGMVPLNALIGKGEARFMSIQGNAPLWAIWDWPFNLRWDRMFQSVYVNDGRAAPTEGTPQG